MKIEEVKLYVASVGGAFLLVIADLVANIDAATTLKVGGVLEKHILGDTSLGPGLLGLLLVLVISAFFCWLYNPTDRIAAFTRGFSVFAVLSVITPYSIIENASQSAADSRSSASRGIDDLSFLSLIPSAHADRPKSKLVCRDGILRPNARLISERRISVCKPSLAGLFGLGSFFNNTMNYCWAGKKLPKNEPVALIKSWETGLRKYRYSKIEFQDNDRVCEGWVSDGRKTVRHVGLD